MQESLRLRANAKLNLFLRVLGTAEGGFHRIETVFQSVGLADVIELGPADPGTVEVEISAPSEGSARLPSSEENLVTAAALRLAEEAGRVVGARIRVTKNIPIGAGLGGGSADAAATLAGLNVLWGLGLEREALARIGATVGSDVGFCMQGGTALGVERGDELTPLPQATKLHFVLGISKRPLMTRDVYDAWDRLGRTAPSDATAISRALSEGDVVAVAANVHNDLLEPALSLRPEIEEGLVSLRHAGALGAGMTGSGPTLFGIAPDRDSARSIAERVAGSFDRVEVADSAALGVESVQ
jgi:4-diphosphocytidyl-2-C-methyl-D-erythritol kinase